MTRQKVYITRYWRTQGVLIQEATNIASTTDGEKPGWASVNIGSKCLYLYANDFWLTEEEALAHVAVLLKKKIDSVEREIKRLKAMQTNLTGLIVDKRKNKS